MWTALVTLYAVSTGVPTIVWAKPELLSDQHWLFPRIGSTLLRSDVSTMRVTGFRSLSADKPDNLLLVKFLRM